MARYMLLYTGGMGMDVAPEDQERITEEWGAWYAKLGDSILDGGAPFGAYKNLTGNGVGDGPLRDAPATGYTVIEADSLDAAVAACDGHPHLSHQGELQVFECIDMNPES